MKEYVVTLVRIRREGLNLETWTDVFCITAPEQTDSHGFLALLKNAVKAFLSTAMGQEAIERTCNDFNWGDVIQEIPDTFWMRYNIRPINQNTPPFSIGGAEAVLVNQDEVLCIDVESGEDDDNGVS